MSSTLHDMVSQALADAETQTKLAEAGGASPTPDVALVGGGHVSSDEAEKIAAAVDEIVANLGDIVDDRSDQEKIAELLLLQEKLADPIPTSPGSGTGMNPAGGAATAMELNESGTPGENPEVHDTPRTEDVPVHPGSEAARLGDGSTTGETNESSPPGGGEEWTDNAPLQKAGSAQEVLDRLKVLAGGAKEAGMGADYAKAKKNLGVPSGAYETAERAVRAGAEAVGKNKGKAALIAGGAAAGATGLAVGAKKALGKKDGEKKASLNRAAVIDLITKVASGGELCKTAGCKSKVGVPGTMCSAHEEDSKVANLREFFEQRLTGGEKEAGDLTSLDSVGAGDVSAAAAGGPDNYFASASEEGPAPPAPRGEKGVSSIDEAIDITKRDAKSVPKTELGEVLDEPAQSAASDSVVDKHLSTGGEAGVKISSATEAAAVKAGLMKVAEEGCSCQGSGTCLYCCIKEATAKVTCSCGGAGMCEACQLAAASSAA